MFEKLLRQDQALRQLRDLYREAEEVSLNQEPESAASEEFAAHRQVIDDLNQLATHIQPTNSAADRAKLLSLLAEKRIRQTREETPMIQKLLQKRTAAFAGAAVLLVGAALSAGAAPGGVSDVAGNVQDVLAALNITDRTPDAADGHIEDIQQPEGTGEGLDTAGAHANDAAQHGLDTAAEGADNAGDGIENASDEGLDHANENALDGPAGGPPDATELPEDADDNAAEGSDNAPQESDNGDAELPGDADDHAENGGGNADVPDGVIPDIVDLPLP
jgi:hypothetical protein